MYGFTSRVVMTDVKLFNEQKAERLLYRILDLPDFSVKILVRGV